MTVAGRCRMADPGWLLRNAIHDQRTGPARLSRETSVSTVTTVLTLVRAGYGVALVCAPQALIKLMGQRGWGVTGSA